MADVGSSGVLKNEHKMIKHEMQTNVVDLKIYDDSVQTIECELFADIQYSERKIFYLPM